MLGHRMFVTAHDADLLHAIDGLKGAESLNLLAMPILNQNITQTQILLRLYRGDESYLQVLRAMQHLCKRIS